MELCAAPGQVYTQQAVAGRHIGEGRLHGLQPALRLRLTESADAAHLVDGALGDVTALEGAQVVQLQPKALLRQGAGVEAGPDPQAGLVDVETPVPVQAAAGQAQRGQRGSGAVQPGPGGELGARGAQGTQAEQQDCYSFCSVYCTTSMLASSNAASQ